MCPRVHTMCMTSICRASVVLFRIAFAIHLSVIPYKHTQRGRPWIQASLTLNLAQADSNFCLQITFQWLHKSAASSSASFGFPRLPLLLHLPLFPADPPLLRSPACSGLTSFFLYKPLPSSLALRLYFTVSLFLLPPLSLVFSFPHTPSLWRWLGK